MAPPVVMKLWFKSSIFVFKLFIICLPCALYFISIVVIITIIFAKWPITLNYVKTKTKNFIFTFLNKYYQYYHIMSKPQLLCYVYLPQAQGRCFIAKKVKNFLKTRVLGVKLWRQQKFRIFLESCVYFCVITIWDILLT